MVLRLLVLALCASSIAAVGIDIRYSRDPPAPPCQSTQCRALVRDYLEQRSCRIDLQSSSLGTDIVAWFIIPQPDGSSVSMRITGLCFGYQLCNTCGNNGACSIEYGEPQCSCEENYEGRNCEIRRGDNPDGSRVAIILAAVIGGLLVIFILIAVVAHWCWSHHARPDILSNRGKVLPGQGVSVVDVGQVPQKQVFVENPPARTPTLRITEVNDDGQPIPGAPNTIVYKETTPVPVYADNAAFTTQYVAPTVRTNIPTVAPGVAAVISL